MTRGVREYSTAAFAANFGMVKEVGYTKFRRHVLDLTVKDMETTIASASTNFNLAKKDYEKANPGATEGLGRAPDKNNGGRKPGSKNVPLAKAATDTPAEPVQLVTVIVEKTGKVVKEGLTVELATALIEKAAAAKKATLVIQTSPAEAV